MQRLAIFLVLTLAIAAPARADAGATPGHHRNYVVEKLQLNPEQAQKFRDIMREQHDKRRAIFNENKEQAQKQPELAALRADTRQRLATVLNPDQMKRFDEIERNRPHRRHGGGKRGTSSHGMQTAPATNTPPAPTTPPTPQAEPASPEAARQN